MGWLNTYAIQVSRDVPVCIDHGLLAAQLDDLADDGHVAPDVAVEVRRGRTRGRLRVHAGWSVWFLVSHEVQAGQDLRR